MSKSLPKKHSVQTGKSAARTSRRTPAARGKPREKGSSILRALAVLEGVVEADRAISPSELIETLDLPKATVHRLCQLLITQGYLQRNLEGKGLLPGARLSRFALGILASSRLRAVRHAVLQQISEEIGETCNISVPDGSEMIYFDRVETHWPLRHQLPIGSRVPLHCTASGKLYLSSLSPARRRRMISLLKLEARTSNSITDHKALEAAIEQIRAQQVGTDNQELLDGMVAVAVPIHDHSGRFCAALATHAPIQRMTLEQAKGFLPVLREGAEQISNLLIDLGGTEEQRDRQSTI